MPPMIITVGDLISLFGLLFGLPLLYLAMQKHIRDQLKEAHDAETAVLRERVAYYETAVDPNVRELIETKISNLEGQLADKDQLIGEAREQAEAEKVQWQQALDEANSAVEEQRKHLEKALADRGVPADQLPATMDAVQSTQGTLLLGAHMEELTQHLIEKELRMQARAYAATAFSSTTDIEETFVQQLMEKELRMQARAYAATAFRTPSALEEEPPDDSPSDE